MAMFGENIGEAVRILRSNPVLPGPTDGVPTVVTRVFVCRDHDVQPLCECGENSYCSECGFGTGAAPCSCNRARADRQQEGDG